MIPRGAKQGFVAVIAAAPAIVAAAPPARMPGPAPILRSFDPVAVNAQCEKCHVEIAAEWRSSLHHVAFTDAPFQRALKRENDPFCVGCHAPEANPKAPEPERAALGVGCVTCHVLDRAPLAVPAKKGAPAPHPVSREASFATERACASCHEFAFPDGHRRRQPLLMQSTVAEHERSPKRDTPCASCHMPRTSGHRSHRFAASRDERMLQSAVAVDARRADPRTIAITVSAREHLGHAFPTGDLFRRFAVVVTPAESPPSTQYFGRVFGPREELPGIIVRAEVADHRVEHGKPRTATFTVPAGAPARYRVTHQRVEFPRHPDGHNAVIDGETIVAEGLVSP